MSDLAGIIRGFSREFKMGGRTHLARAGRDIILRLLTDYEPPADRLAGFEDLWEDIGI